MPDTIDPGDTWMSLALKREADIRRLKEAGDRILNLLTQVSDQALDEQAMEHNRMVDGLRRIWVEAKSPGSVR